MKAIINIISLIRFPIAVLILLNSKNTTFVAILLILAGITDILDGFLARKFKLTSKFGANIDTASDFVIFATVIYILLMNSVYIFDVYFKFIVLILALKLIAYIIGIIRYKRLLIRHTILNKITGFMFFFITIVYFATLNSNLYMIVVGLAILATIEELMINFIYKNLDLDLKSIFKIKD